MSCVIHNHSNEIIVHLCVSDITVRHVCQVINWRQTLHIPSDACLSSDTEDLILRLCCDAADRLGRPPGATADVKSHPFFTGIEFDSLRRCRAPYVPHLRYATDTSHFDTTDTEDRPLRRSASLDSLLSPSNTAVTAGGLAPSCDGSKYHAFLEFTFRRFFDADGHAHATRITDGPVPVYV